MLTWFLGVTSTEEEDEEVEEVEDAEKIRAGLLADLNKVEEDVDAEKIRAGLLTDLNKLLRLQVPTLRPSGTEAPPSTPIDITPPNSFQLVSWLPYNDADFHLIGLPQLSVSFTDETDVEWLNSDANGESNPIVEFPSLGR